jgi:8-oxo-dGTP pyrophosphatase MutT (NUDIX family)
MPNQQPIITDAAGQRQFTCSAAGVLAFIIDPDEHFLLLSNPKRDGKWEVVNGALEAEETILEAVLREVREEAGEHVQVRPLATLHTYTYCYDAHVQYMISVAYLLAYEDGDVNPGDDMAGSQFRWFTLDEIERQQANIIVPTHQLWLFRRAIQLYRLFKDQPPIELQPRWDETTKNKYSSGQ